MLSAEKIIKKIERNFYPDFSFYFPRIVKTSISRDSTVKHLMEFHGETRVESVIMPFHKRDTICLSSQSGCAMGCTYCETGSQGFFRSLSSREIIAQYLACYRWIIRQRNIRHIPKPNIVFMGEGEPLHNFENIREACSLLLSPEGVSLGPRQITLSTSGYLPGLKRIHELPPVNFALSLHSAIPEKRARLMPVEKENSIEKILEILDRLVLKKNQYINFEYMLIPGFNDSDEDADALAKITRRYPSIVNIIPCNAGYHSPWREPSESDISRFRKKLVSRDIRTMVRNSRGKEIGAACGQLKGAVFS